MNVYRVEAWLGSNPHTVVRYVAAETIAKAAEVVPPEDQITSIELLGGLYENTESLLGSVNELPVVEKE